MGECAPVTKHERQRKLNHNPPSEKESKETKAKCTVSVLGSYITYSKKYVYNSSFLIAADLFSSYEDVHYEGLCN